MKRESSRLLATLIILFMSVGTVIAQDWRRYEAESGRLSGGTKIMSDHSGYSGTGFVAGFEDPGARIIMQVASEYEGSVRVKVRYAASWRSTQFLGVYVNGIRSGQLQCETMADWDTWAETFITVELRKGSNDLEFVHEKENSGVVNIDFLEIYQKNSIQNPTVQISPAADWLLLSRFEAENAVLSGTAVVMKDHSGYTGKGFVAGFERAGAMIHFPFSASERATWTLALRYANGTGSRQVVSIYLDGIKVSDLVCDSPGGWDSWATVTLAMSFPQGKHMISIKRDREDSGTINLDNIEVY